MPDLQCHSNVGMCDRRNLLKVGHLEPYNQLSESMSFLRRLCVSGNLCLLKASLKKLSHLKQIAYFRVTYP